MTSESQSRREWLTGAARWGALAGLAAVSGRLLTRSGECTRQLPCQTCGLVARCELPRARQAEAEGTRST
jgi:hypothetical protein